VINLIALGIVNRITGAIFGGIKITLILSVIMLILNQVDVRVNFLPNDLLSGSILYEPLLMAASKIIPGLGIREFIAV